MMEHRITILRCVVLKSCNPPRSNISRACYIIGGWLKAASRPWPKQSLTRRKQPDVQSPIIYNGARCRAVVLPCPENQQWHRVIYHLRPRAPLVSIIVPTRDQLPLLQRCLTSIREKTDYAPIEIVIVDNGSTKPETHAFLHDLALDPHIQILTETGEFNFSRLINCGARAAHAAKFWRS